MRAAMPLTLAASLLITIACDGGATRTATLAGPSPVSPPPAMLDPPPMDGVITPTWLLGFVVDRSGLCIDGGTVEVVSGQRLGERITQETPCDAWAYSGGFVFRDLMPGVEMIMRVSAPGYAPLVQSVTPYSGPQTGFVFWLSKIE